MKNFLKKLFNKNWIIPGILFLLTFCIVGQNLNKPFVGIHDWNGARYGNIARNYVRYGFFETKFAQVENSGIVPPEDFVYYTHYQPLLPLLIAVSYSIGGIDEATTRIVPLLATSGIILLLYFIGTTLWNKKTGMLTGLLALMTPMVVYFGKNPVHEPLALAFSLLAFYGIALYIKEKKYAYNYMYIGLLLTLFVNWSGVFLAGSLFVLFLLKKECKQALFVAYVTVALVLLHFAHIYVATGSLTGGGLVEGILLRTGIGGGAELTHFTLYEYLHQIWLWASNLFTLTLIITAFLGLYFLYKNKTKELLVFFLTLFIYSLYPLVLPNASFLHNYFIFYWVAPFSLLAAYGISSSTKNHIHIGIISIIVLGSIWFEKQDFLHALEKSSIDSLAVQIAKDIHVQVPENESVFIAPLSFAQSRYPHLAFYSDRRITFDENSGYNWRVEVNEQDGSYTILRQ